MKKWLRALGLIVLIAGIACLFFSSYIMQQVNEGKGKIQKGEQAMKQGNQLFSLNPVTKEVGKNFTNPIQQKINAGKETIAHYENMAQMLYTTGIIGIIAGGVLFIVSFFCKPKKRR